MTDADELKEKYYHSMGAALTGEGDLEEAVVSFQKAIDIGDTPYAWCGLARALREAGDTAGAVGAMTRAIKLAPGTPEYYYERAKFLRDLGRPDLADGDVEKAIAIDRNYERIETVRWAARIVSDAFAGPVVPGEVKAAEVHGEGLRRILDAIEHDRRGLDDVLRAPSCPAVSCPAYCCHFVGKLLLHGVTVGPWKLKNLRTHFGEKGLSEEDFLEVFPVDRAEHCESLFPPQDVMKRDGAASVTFPRQKECLMGGELARHVPRGRDYETLMWTGERAKPCVFLAGGKCSIYDVGGEPSLESCASFLCMTGFVLVVLKHLGVVDAGMVEDKSMGEMNDIAVEALIILARDVYGSDEVVASSEAMARELQTAIEEDISGSERAGDRAVERYRLLRSRHDNLMDILVASAEKKIGTLFSGTR